jgi:hypothetical protein
MHAVTADLMIASVGALMHRGKQMHRNTVLISSQSRGWVPAVQRLGSFEKISMVRRTVKPA